MRNLCRLAAFCVLALVGAAAAAPHSAATPSPWMTEDGMRAAFIGKTLDGHYVDGLRWTETYGADGRLDYRESVRGGTGYWYFRGHVFCTFYDPGFGLSGGCWTAIKTSTNCYEFYVAGLPDARPEEEAAPRTLGRWAARAWHKGEPPTCDERPSV